MGKEQHRHDISGRAWEKIRPFLADIILPKPAIHFAHNS